MKLLPRGHLPLQVRATVSGLVLAAFMGSQLLCAGGQVVLDALGLYEIEGRSRYTARHIERPARVPRPPPARVPVRSEPRAERPAAAPHVKGAFYPDEQPTTVRTNESPGVGPMVWMGVIVASLTLALAALGVLFLWPSSRSEDED